MATITFLVAPPMTMVAAIPQIVFLGDSLTAGYGVTPAQAYPALIQQKISRAGLNWKIVNAGRSGDSTADGLRRVSGVVDTSTHILFVALGANDGLRQISPTQINANLVEIIVKARASFPTVKVILVGMHMPAAWVGEAYSRAYDEAFLRAAKSQDAILLPYLLENVGGVAALNQLDKLHPTAKGQQIIAGTVWKILKPLL